MNHKKENSILVENGKFVLKVIQQRKVQTGKKIMNFLQASLF